MVPSKLTPQQKYRLKILEPKLKTAIGEKDYKAAKSLVQDLQALLRPTGHITRLAQYKIRLYELALELNNLHTAIEGLASVRKVVSFKTRLYLEATSLEAICYLRQENLEKAKPLIKAVLKNDSVIKTPRTRKIFRAEIIDRFNQEISLFSLKNKVPENFTKEDLEEIIAVILTSQNEDEIFLNIGRTVPQHTKFLLFEVHQFSTNQLPSAERLALPSPEQKVQDEEVGRTVYQSVKRVLYNSICNPESEIYKIWYTNGVEILLSKGYLSTAVMNCMANIGIGLKFLSASVVALILKFGLEVYCEKNKPVDLMDLRGM